ncbi:hypothetical protein [Bacillus cereus]
MSLAFTASLLLGGAIPAYAEENPDNGIEPIPFENIESESKIVTNDGLPGSSTAVPIYCDGLSALYLGSNEVVGQSVSASSSNLALIGVTGNIYKNGKYYTSKTAANNNSKNVSITNKATFSSGSKYQQDGTHKFITYSGQSGVTYTSRAKTF